MSETTEQEFVHQSMELALQLGKIAEGKPPHVVAGSLVTMVVGLLIKHPPEYRRKNALQFHNWLIDTLEGCDYLPEYTADSFDAVRAVIVGSLALAQARGVSVQVGETADDSFIERLSAVIEQYDEVPNLISDLMTTLELETSEDSR